MKVIAGFVALAATLALVNQADATTYRKQKRGYVQQYRAYAPSVDRVRDDDNSASGYY